MMRNVCFSTETVDLDHQAPNRNQRESLYFWDELNRLIAAGGFHGIEIPYEPKWDFGGRSGIPRSMRSVTVKFETVQAYCRYLKDNGIERIDCIHFNPSLFCQGAMPMYFGAFEHFAMEALEFCSEAKCGILSISVTPPVYRVGRLSDVESEEQFLSDTAALIEKLASQARNLDVKICLKNEFWSLLRGDRITEYLNRFETDVFLDLDTAHLYIAGAKIQKVLADNAQRIGIVHLTDTSFLDQVEAWKSALPEFPAARPTKVFVDPGFGSVDLKGVLGALDDAGYEGALVLNPRNSYDICRSILRAAYFRDHVML